MTVPVARVTALLAVRGVGRVRRVPDPPSAAPCVGGASLGSCAIGALLVAYFVARARAAIAR